MPQLLLFLILLTTSAAQRRVPGGGGGGTLPTTEDPGSDDGSIIACPLDGSETYMTVSLDTIDGVSTRVVQSTSCPNYDWSSQTTPGNATIQDLQMYFPAEPVLCSHSTASVGVYVTVNDSSDTVSVPVQGPIGVSYNGVPIFGNADGDYDDAYINEGESFDQCKGHNGPGGEYHYHVQVPDECLITEPSSGSHSDIFGMMADGIPIYGPKGDSGVVPTGLDECNGHVDESHPFYHYYVTADYVYPYTVNCLKGEINVDLWTNFGDVSTSCTDVADTQYDYSSIESEFVSIGDE